MGSSRKGKKLYWYCPKCKRVLTNNLVRKITEPVVKDYHIMNCITNHKDSHYRMYI